MIILFVSHTTLHHSDSMEIYRKYYGFDVILADFSKTKNIYFISTS